MPPSPTPLRADLTPLEQAVARVIHSPDGLSVHAKRKFVTPDEKPKYYPEDTPYAKASYIVSFDPHDPRKAAFRQLLADHGIDTHVVWKWGDESPSNGRYYLRLDLDQHGLEEKLEDFWKQEVTEQKIATMRTTVADIVKAAIPTPQPATARAGDEFVYSDYPYQLDGQPDPSAPAESIKAALEAVAARASELGIGEQLFREMAKGAFPQSGRGPAG